jgi:hypothetical protein
MKVNSVHNSVRGGYCDYSPRAPKKLATTLVATMIDRVVVCRDETRLTADTDCLNLLFTESD